MTLSEAEKATGRALVAARDIGRLMTWAREHAPVGLDHATYEKTMRLCFLAEDTLRAMKMHNAVFDTYDADVERARIVLGKAIGCGIIVASVGGLGIIVLGFVALWRVVFP